MDGENIACFRNIYKYIVEIHNNKNARTLVRVNYIKKKSFNF